MLPTTTLFGLSYLYTIDIQHAPLIDGRAPFAKKIRLARFSMRFIALSLLAHGVVIFVILGKLNIPAPSELPNQDALDEASPKIKSYLYVRPKPVEPPQAVVPDISVNKEQPTIVSELLVEQKTDTPNDASEALNIDQETPASELQSDISRYGLRDSIQKQLQSMEAAKLNDIAQSASRAFSKSLISPTVEAPVYTNEYLYSKQIGANLITCDDSIKTKLKLLATVFGGNVRCRDKDFQKFIDQRLSKGTEDK